MIITRRTMLMAGAGALVWGTRKCRFAQAATSSHPKALLLGDSISIGYTDFVVGILDGEVDVHRPLNANGGYLNCEGTTKAKAEIDSWLGVGSWDVIHFNFGLHDLKHVDPVTGRNSRKPEDPQQANVEQYAENLEAIVTKLKSTKAPLIFATTTPYPDDPGGPLRDPGQPERYNAAALAIMRRHGVTVNDLYGLVHSRMDEFLPPRNVHPRRAAYLVMARQVVAHLRKALAG